MSTWLHWATLALYLAGTGIYLSFLLWQKNRLSDLGKVVLWLGFALHTLGLGAAWLDQGAFPALNLRQALDVFAWAVMGGGLLINLRTQVLILGAFTAPLAAIMLSAASVLPQMSGPTSPVLKSLWVVSHILTMLAGYGLYTLNFLGSVLYLVQERMIRKKRLGPAFRRLPSLSRLDNMNAATLMSGFILFTLGMTFGVVYGHLALGAYWQWDPKEAWTLATWLLYAALIHTRLVQGWRGRKGAWFAVFAYGILLFTFLGGGLLFSSYHSFEGLQQLKGVPR